MNAADPWAYAPKLTVQLPCDALPVRWTRGVLRLGGHHSEAERAMVALSGAPAPCERLAATWSNLTDSRFAPTVTSCATAGIDRLRPPDARHDVPVDAAFVRALKRVPRVAGLPPRHRPADAQAGGVVPAVELMDDLARDGVHRAVVAALPEPLLAVALATVMLERSNAEAWARVAFDEALDAALLIQRFVAKALGTVPSWTEYVVDPWNVGEASARRFVVPPSWFASVWLSGATVIEGNVTVSLRPTFSAGRGIARLVSPEGQEVVRHVERGVTGWVFSS